MKAEIKKGEFLKKGISGSTLKIIAVITMLIDHIGAAGLISNELIYKIFRYIGRVSFPIFCFLIVEGFLHTKDTKKYFLRLLTFAFISELPFDFAFFNRVYINYQNVFFTLALGLLALIFIKKFEKNIFLQIVSTVAIAVVSELLNTDYASLGVMLIVAVYILRDKKIIRSIVIAIMTIGHTTAPLSVLFIWQYNGKRGLNLKYVFYAFYPVHLIILYLIRVI